MAAYIQQYTLAYKTFIKRALVEALQEAWTSHPDPTVAAAKIAIDFTEDDFKLPAVLIKFYESSLDNAGVGHYEWFPDPLTADPTDPATTFTEYMHRMYKGDIEFEIYGLSSADRDLLADALIEVLAMAEVSAPGLGFLDRLYNKLQQTPYGLWHFATLNLDQIKGYGEQEKIAPWNPEDLLVYQTAYRVPIFGEFYSNTPPIPSGKGMVSEVDVYLWPSFNGTVPLDPSSPAPPVPASDYHKFTGEPVGVEDL